MARRSITARVAEFYSEVPYPYVWLLRRPDQPGFLRGRLNYALGRQGRSELPRRMRIWVPGAGTTLGVQLALSCPDAEVLATDLSPASLAIASGLAAELGAGNLTTKVESLLDGGYREEFDYIECTGVLNHVEDPHHGWKVLARALRPGGAASIFIYNAEHRWVSDTWQDCLATLGLGKAGLEPRWKAAAALLAAVKRSSALPTLQQAVAAIDPVAGREDFGDTLVHPHEVSYALKDVYALVEGAGLAFAGWRSPEEWDPATYLEHPALNKLTARLGERASAELVWRLAGRDSPYFDFYVEKRVSRRPRSRHLAGATRLQRLTGTTYINVRGNRVHSQWHLPSMRLTANGAEVMRNEDARHKSEAWVSVPARTRRLLERCDGTVTVDELLPTKGRARDDGRRVLGQLLSPAYGVLAPA